MISMSKYRMNKIQYHGININGSSELLIKYKIYGDEDFTSIYLCRWDNEIIDIKEILSQKHILSNDVTDLKINGKKYSISSGNGNEWNNLTSLELIGVTSIGDFAFKNASNLENVYIDGDM